MGIAKFDDGFPEGPKFLAAGPLASWLWVCGVCYCRRTFTDGFIPRRKVPTLSTISAPFKQADRLVEVGLWEREGENYRVHDYLDWNPAKEVVEDYRRRDRERKRVKFPDRIPDGIHTDSDQRGASRADTKKKREKKSESDRLDESAREAAFEVFWKAYPKKVSKPNALQAFRRVNPDAALLAVIVSALEASCLTLKWRKDGGEFIPHAATWLNGRRWEDEIGPAVRPRALGPSYAATWESDCARLHNSECAGEIEHGQKMAKAS